MSQLQDELKCSLLAVEKERDGTQERLMAAKETLAAQERELQNKDARYGKSQCCVTCVATLEHSLPGWRS